MENKKFAFESDEVSIAFYSIAGLGDCIIARKVFDAIVELHPSCVIDYYCITPAHREFVKAFYGDSKNLNRLLNFNEYRENLKKYDLALFVGGCHAIFLEWVNNKRLSAMSPKFFQALVKIDIYNKNYFLGLGNWKLTVALRNMISAKILGKDCFHFLSYEGALPIHDNKIKIPLLPEYKIKFDELKLGKYITIYTDLPEKERNRPKVKAWPIRYFTEYIARMKKHFPDVEVIQVGGKDEVKVENCDRYYLGVELELTKHILSNSLLHVGGEGGLVHFATALETKCLVIFGPNSHDYTGYNQNINLVSEVCHPCMYIVPDFQVCMLGSKEPPCMLSITPQKVFEVTRNYLERLEFKNKE